jgi:hypothetical protein
MPTLYKLNAYNSNKQKVFSIQSKNPFNVSEYMQGRNHLTFMIEAIK